MGVFDSTRLWIIIGIGIFIFILVREIVSWYFKINRRIELQQKMLETLLKIYEQNGGIVNWDEVNPKDFDRKGGNKDIDSSQIK